MAGRVLVVGSVNVDDVLGVERLPLPGETVLATATSRGHGGKGGNQACAAARWGSGGPGGSGTGTPVWLVARVGDDQDGRDAVADLLTFGVLVDEAVPVPGVPTGRAVVMVDPRGENSIVVASGANAELTGDAVNATLQRLGPSEGDVVLSNGEVSSEVVAAVAATCRRAGVLHVHNLAPVRRADVAACAGSLLVLNEVELGQATSSGDSPEDGPGDSPGDDSEDRLASLAAGRPGVVLTLGAQGAVVAVAEGQTPVAAVAAEVVDTTGAGDAFCGALATELAAGADLVEAVGLAVLAGSYAVTGHGARGALATRSQVGGTDGPAGPGTDVPGDG